MTHSTPLQIIKRSLWWAWQSTFTAFLAVLACGNPIVDSGLLGQALRFCVAISVINLALQTAIVLTGALMILVAMPFNPRFAVQPLNTWSAA